MSTSSCICCGGPLPRPGSRGPRRVYCSGACRERARRQRNAALRFVAEPALGPVVAELLPRAHPDEQGAVAILEAHAVAGAFERLSRVVRPQLAWHYEVVAAGLRGLLVEHFGDL